jgi:iron(III) transport system substrate-binding protein
MTRKLRYILIYICVFCIITDLSNQLVYGQEKSPKGLVVFSGRKEPLIKPVIELFQDKTGVHVILKTGKSMALGQQILQELPNPSADVYIAKESGSLEYLRLKNAFAVYRSKATEKIPQKFKAGDDTWIGVSGRTRALLFNTTLLNREEVPGTIMDLTQPKWKGKIAAVNSGNESFIAWVSALRLKLGEEATKDLLLKLKENGINLISQSHTDIRKAVGRGEYPLGLINHYYYHLQKHEIDPELRNVDIVYQDQQKDQRGEIVNVSGVAIVKGAKNLSEAKQFVDFLASQEAQKLFAEVNFEYPLLPGVQAHKEVRESLGCNKDSVLDCIHIMDVHLDQLGLEMEKTLELLDEVQWF